MTIEDFLKDKKSDKCVDKLPESKDKQFRVSQYARNVEDAIRIENKLIKYPNVIKYRKSSCVFQPGLIWFYVTVSGF